jgi:hypothetical protein
MGTFKQFVEEKQISKDAVVHASRRLEAYAEGDRELLQKRAVKRRDKDRKDKPYAELGIGKPKNGRGASDQQWQLALADKPLGRKARGKLLRAVNAVLSRKGGGSVDGKALFGEVPVRRGVNPKAKAKAA